MDEQRAKNTKIYIYLDVQQIILTTIAMHEAMISKDNKAIMSWHEISFFETAVRFRAINYFILLRIIIL